MIKQKRSEKKTFHVHADIHKVGKNLREELEKFGFYRATLESVEGARHPAPTEHYTYKARTQEAANKAMKHASKAMRSTKSKGYIEAEIIAYDGLFGFDLAQVSHHEEFNIIVPQRDYNKKAKPSFKLDELSLPTPTGKEFRDSEVHVVFDKEQSNPQVIKELMDMGFNYVERKDKNGHGKEYTKAIFTVQGVSSQMAPFMHRLEHYLIEKGGIIMGRVKWEVILRNNPVGYDLVDITPQELMNISEITLLNN